MNRLAEPALAASHRAVGLTPERLDSAGELLAEAFHDNPPHVYICRDERSRPAKLSWLLRANLRVQPDLRASSFAYVSGAHVEAMGFWTPPRATAPGLFAQLRAGLLAMPLHLSWAEVGRAREVADAVEEQKRRAFGKAPYWYLNNMVVRTALQGSGLGSRLLREQMDRVRAIDARARFGLTTQREENLRFYRRLGYEVVLEEILGDPGPWSFPSWVMVTG